MVENAQKDKKHVGVDYKYKQAGAINEKYKNLFTKERFEEIKNNYGTENFDWTLEEYNAIRDFCEVCYNDFGKKLGLEKDDYIQELSMKFGDFASGKNGVRYSPLFDEKHIFSRAYNYFKENPEKQVDSDSLKNVEDFMDVKLIPSAVLLASKSLYGGNFSPSEEYYNKQIILPILKDIIKGPYQFYPNSKRLENKYRALVGFLNGETLIETANTTDITRQQIHNNRKAELERIKGRVRKTNLEKEDLYGLTR